MEMLLPRGIVENTPEIYAEIASYPVVPPEKICQYWNVYTTTFRRLCDPTAYRLENFWWHVWGSDRRNLSGPALAKLFEEFSNGETFVPLRSVKNRYEGPSIPRARRQHSPEKAEPEQSKPQKLPKEVRQPDSIPKTNNNVPTPSSSRPAPAHPILKKSRGPSTSGTRPTARFVSPPASEGEDGGKADDVSSGSTAVSTSEMLPPSVKREKAAASKATGSREVMPPPPLPVSSKKEGKSRAVESGMRPPSTQSPGRSEKGSTPTRRIVASTAASKRRPSMPRRQSSQSSASSIASSSSNVPKHALPSNMVLQPERGSHSSSASSQASLLLMGSKAAGKRPAKSAPKRSTSQSDSSQADSSQGSFKPVATPPQRQYLQNIGEMAIASPSTPATRPAPIAGFVGDPRSETITPRVERSISLVEAPKRARDGSMGGPVAQALVSSSVVGTSNTTARGRFDSETITPQAVVSDARDIPDSLLPAHRPAYPGPLDGQFAPTPPNPAPPVPFGRSMSQLTLLLERDKPRRN
ncbi:hypothetical protein V8F33_008381 [Rhypophila sp. PSN 637]